MQQNTPEWLEMRKSKIGASDAPIIMGESPWKTPYQLWQQKLDLVSQEDQNHAMRRGHEMEPIARDAYIKHTGINIEPKVVFHPERDWMMASLDGYNQERGVAVEIKCPGEKDHALAAEGKIPPKYYAQLQHQLAVLGLNKIHYFSFREDSFYLIEVEMDEAYIKKMIKKEEAFMKCLREFQSPELSDRDLINQQSDEWKQSAEAWIEVNEQLKILKDKEKEARERLIALTNNKSSKGAGVKALRTIRKGNIDYNQIPEIKVIDLEPYRKSSITTWRITKEKT
jgi:putative phage-type endonuclease